MATSGTTGFSLSRDQIILRALRLLQVYAPGETVDPAIIATCAESLNVWVKSLVVKGLPLWTVQEVTIPNVTATNTYQIGPAATPATPRPIRILYALLRSATGSDVEVQVVSRYDYATLGYKSSPGNVNQLYYDPQLGTGQIKVFSTPLDGSQSLVLTIQRQIQDFNASTDTPDLPQEAYQMLCWGLADEIALEFETKPQVVNVIGAKAAQYKEEFLSFMQEYASVYFTPSQKK